MTDTTPYTIDAAGKKLGRVATEAATALMGKDRADKRHNAVPERAVIVTGISGLDISSKKMKEKVYISYSGYPGGQKKRTLADIIEKKGHGEALRRAVYGMLPGNRLRSKMLRRLITQD